MTDGVERRPDLMGASKPAHVLTTAATSRRIVNMTALARKPRCADREGTRRS